MDLNERMIEIRKIMDEKGFSASESRIWELLTLIHSEISESADAFRKGKDFEEVGKELIDAIMRTLHLLSVLGQNPEELYQSKLTVIRKRPTKWNTVRGG